MYINEMKNELNVPAFGSSGHEKMFNRQPLELDFFSG